MISTVLRPEVWPVTMRMHALDTPSASAIVAPPAALPWPRSAGSVTRTLSVSPSHPAMALREDPATTLICNRIVVPPLLAGCPGIEWSKTVHRDRLAPDGCTPPVSRRLVLDPVRTTPQPGLRRT